MGNRFLGLCRILGFYPFTEAGRYVGSWNLLSTLLHLSFGIGTVALTLVTSGILLEMRELFRKQTFMYGTISCVRASISTAAVFGTLMNFEFRSGQLEHVARHCRSEHPSSKYLNITIWYLFSAASRLVIWIFAIIQMPTNLNILMAGSEFLLSYLQTFIGIMLLQYIYFIDFIVCRLCETTNLIDRKLVNIYTHAELVEIMIKINSFYSIPNLGLLGVYFVEVLSRNFYLSRNVMAMNQPVIQLYAIDNIVALVTALHGIWILTKSSSVGYESVSTNIEQ
ncbi:Hypothetical protein NTJ_15867 [Nesidiocoris tenuis]|uniref:Gustatory receptor n=1 Tax=Nesidiocoris tenuis TaxID=355587 RepID=A0ABN7BF98_9HEMI|nr:Hypothetical protein NTJ_15867 [Nesidiocoris tenuis]